LHVDVREGDQKTSAIRDRYFDASRKGQVKEAGGNVVRRDAHAVVCKGEGVLKTLERSRSVWAQYAADARALSARLTTGDLKALDGDAKDRIYQSATEEAKRAAPYPIQTTDVPPEQFYYWKTDGLGLTLACEVKQVPYLDTLMRYDAALDGGGRVVCAYGEARPGGSDAVGGLPAASWRSVMSGVSTLTLVDLWRRHAARTHPCATP